MSSEPSFQENHSGIGSLNESSFHAALKRHYCGEDAQVEMLVAGFVIDIIDGPQLIEIQTGSFSAIRNKLYRLLEQYPVKLVYPITGERWLVKLPQSKGFELVRRKSPKNECLYDIFNELVSFPKIFHNKRFTLEIAVTAEEEVRQYSGKRPWRRNGWEIVDRRLIKVLRTHLFKTTEDFCVFLPETLPVEFTTQDLAQHAQISRRLAQKTIYCLCKMGEIILVGKRARFLLYRRRSE